MSKRDRAARAKEAAEGAATSAADELAAADATASPTDEVRPTGKRSGRGRRAAGAPDVDTDTGGGAAVAVKERKKKASPAESRNPLVRIWVFLQQVVAELKKVIWPDRREMITYTIVVLVFVIVVTAFISGVDLGFAKGVLWLFG
ncbi:MAG: preprotein translocase subunit SecE [Gordonia sp. (in: high G+C Gram-positive bacteria)]